MSTAQAVTPGQGQTVNIAGVEVGEIASVQLRDGKAIIGMRIKPKYDRDLQGRVGPAAPEDRPEGHGRRAHARAPRPPGQLEEGGVIPVSQTLPDVNLDEILSSLDTDTRDYLLLLLNDGAQGLGSERKGRELAQAIRRIEPTAQVRARDQRGARAAPREHRARRAQLLAADRRARPARHAARELRAEHQRGLRDAGRPGRGAAADPAEAARRRCRRRRRRWQGRDARRRARADARGAAARPPARSGRRCARRGRSCASRRRSSATRSARSPAPRCPTVKELRPAMRDLAAATPDLTRSFKVVNRLLNAAAYNPPGDRTRATCSGRRGSTTPATRCSPPRTRTARSGAA